MPQEVELLIKILSARGLRDAADLSGLQAAYALPERNVRHPPMQKPGRQTMEPYCICEIMGRDDPDAPTVRTESLIDEDSPQWNYKKKMVIIEGDTLIFMVNWKDDDSEDDLIGWAKLEFEAIVPNGFVGELRLTDASASKELPAFVKVAVKPSSLEPEELEQEVLPDHQIEDQSEAVPPLAPMSSHFVTESTEIREPREPLPENDPVAIPVGSEFKAEEPQLERPPSPGTPSRVSSPRSPPDADASQQPLPSAALPGQVERSDQLDPAMSPSVVSYETTTDLGSPVERLEAPPKKQTQTKAAKGGKKRTGGAGKPPPPPPKVPDPPPLVPKKELSEHEEEVVSAIDLLCRQKRPLRQSLEEALDVRQTLVDADADEEGKLSTFGVKADEGPRSFGQVLAQAWTGNAGRSPAPAAHLLPWPSQEVSHREVPGLRSLGKSLAARLRGLLLHLERAVALDPEISAADLLQQQMLIEAGKPEVNLKASGLGKFPPPLMVAGNVEPMPLVLTAFSSDEEEDSPRWPQRSSVKENRSKVKGCTIRVAGQSRSSDAGFGAHPELRILALQGKFEDAHGSLSAAFAAMDLESRGYVSFGDFHSHLVRLHLSSVDAEGSSRAMELFKLLDSDGDDLLSPRDCLKAFKGAANLLKERADNAVHQERLKAFLRERGLPLDMQIPRHKALGGDQYSRAMSLQRYLVLKYGSLYEAIHSMDSSGIGFVSKEDFVQRLLADRYCLSEFEAEELFQSFDPWGKGWLPLQRMLEYEVSGMEWLRPWVNAASPRSISPRQSPRSASPRSASPRSASPRSASPRSTARRSGTRSPDRFFASPRSGQGRDLTEEEDRSDFLFSDPGRLDGPPPSSPRCQATKRSPRSSVYERLHVAGTGYKRVLPGDDALRSAYHNLDEAKKLMEEMKKKAKERAATAMKAVDEARDRALAAKAAAASGSVPASLQGPGPVERFRASRPGTSPGPETSPGSETSQAPAVPTINLQRAKDDESLGPLTPATTPREAAEDGSNQSPTPRISAVRAMASAASAASAQSGESRSALQQRRKAREQRRKEIMKVMDADGDGVITKSELDQLKASNPELSQVDMSKLDADGDGQISKEELEKALDFDGDPQTQAQEAASLFSAVANLFGQRPSQVAETEEKKPSEGEVKADEATVEGPKPDENKDSTPTPKAKALPKALFAMTRVNFVAGRKGSLAVSSAEDQGTSQASAARKRRDLRKAGKAAALLSVPGRQGDAGDG